MTEMFMTYVMPLISLAMFATPALLVSCGFPRRANFEARVVLGIVVMLVFLAVFNPDMDNMSQESIPVSEFVSTAAFFAITLALMMLLVFFCFDVSLMSACYCAVVAYTIENLGASLAELIDLILIPEGFPEVVPYMLLMLAMCLVVYAVYYLVVVRNDPHTSPAEPGAIAFVLFFTVILVSIVFDLAVKRLPALGLNHGYIVLFRVTQIVMCASILALEYEVLYTRTIRIQAATTERLLRDREAQYELSRDTIDAINIKMHDIRHQIRHLEDGSEGTTVLDREVLREIARGVNVYDSTVKTGNDALDTILTEKTLLGEREHISLACIVDGEALSFMSDADLYALFGNAIENAFEAVRILKDTERRNISLLVRRVANMASIHIENYYDGRLLLDSDGKPVTSKGDTENHGYGIKSMRQICERYGGTLSFDASGNTFSVNMLIPIP